MTELAPEAAALLSEMDAANAPPLSALTASQAQALWNATAASRAAEDVARIADYDIPGPDGPLSVRLYEPEGDGPKPGLVYLHGGGFVLGTLDTHDNICTRLANASGCSVLAVDYRLAPEHPFPAALHDAYAAVEWFVEHGEEIGIDTDRVAVGGDSAGGNLTAGVTLMARDHDGPDIVHQLLVYPVVASPAVHDFESYEENAEGYYLETRTMTWFLDHYVADRVDLRNEYFAPLLASDLSGLPPATVLTAGFDPLRDEGEAYAEALAEAGVSVDTISYPDQIHGFVTKTAELSAAAGAIEDLGERVAAALSYS